jgi:hypothetical protein
MRREPNFCQVGNFVSRKSKLTSGLRAAQSTMEKVLNSGT